MTADRLVSVIGLGFGDCGKGLVTDALVRRHRADTVVRFNGGGQAGHTVVLPDGRHHTFSQFGAGSFVAGVGTVLAAPVVVHPTALLEEARALHEAGVHDAVDRLLVDPRCRVTTPFHQAAGRLRERQRGAAAHGSCGAGFGETVGHALAHPDEALHWGDLQRPGGAVERLAAIRTTLLAGLARDGVERGAADRHADPEAAHDAHRDAAAEWAVFDAPGLADRWLALACGAAQRVRAASRDDIVERLARPGTLVCEGAQGMLLDERHGFHPHTTWSRVGVEAVEAAMAEAGRPAEVVHLGVLRSHLTRHGAGPLPSEDASLDARLPEPHNAGTGWQGRFRRGHPDALLLRYAVAAAGPLDGLVVTHLDAVERGVGLRWCDGYRAAPAPSDEAVCVRDAADRERIVALRVGGAPGIDHGARLAGLLRRVVADFAADPVRGAADLVERMEAASGLPVRYASTGPTHEHLVAWPSARGATATAPAGAHNAARRFRPETPRP